MNKESIILTTKIRVIAQVISASHPVEAYDLLQTACEVAQLITFADEIVAEAQEEEMARQQKKWKPTKLSAADGVEELVELEKQDALFDACQLAPGEADLEQMQRIYTSWRKVTK